MACKFVAFVACLAVAQAGLVEYNHAPVAATSHSSVSHHTVAHAAPLTYAAPVAKYAAPTVTYAQAAPVAHYAAAPAVHYAAAPAVHYSAPVVAKTLVAAPVAKAVEVEQYAPAHYDFEYAVQDPHTGDFKSQKESRKGDAVQGSYSLVEADGTRRVVEYTADAHSGFNAVVHREPAQHPVAVKAVAPVVKTVAAPVVAKYAAPAVHYAAAPAVHYAAAPAVHYSAPVAKVAVPAVQYAAAPAVHYAAAPAVHYAAAPAVHYAAPVHGYHH